jgi:hypothetical protein
MAQAPQRFEQRALHHLALAGTLALAQRGDDAECAERAAEDVDDRRAGAQRPTRRARHVSEPRHELHHFIEREAILVRAAEEALERAIDQPRVELRHVLVAAAKPVHRAGRIVLGQRVGAGDQLVRQRAALRVLDVDGNAALIAVEAGEEAGGKAVQAARLVAVGRGLDLDHVRPQIAQHQPTGRPHDRLAELHHPHPRERQRRPVRRCCHQLLRFFLVGIDL